MIRFHARTDIGKKRKNNEDSLLATDEHGLFVVADGVGGRNAGELASAISVNTFQKYGPKLHAAVSTYADDPTPEHRNVVLQLLDEAANTASKRVFEAATTTGRQGMTTTLVAAVVGGGAAFLVHVGDSRAYLVRDGQLRQLTEDHSMVNQLLRQGTITPEEARTSRYRNVITRAVGLYPTVQADTLFVELVSGDRLMLCSDGCSDLIEPAPLCGLLRSGSVNDATDALIEASLDAGGKDNITVIVIEPEAVLDGEIVEAHARAMERLFLFRDLPFHARLRVGRVIRETRVPAGEKLVSQGDRGDLMFTVISGTVKVMIDDVEAARLSAGEHFGELALVDELPRSATIIALDDVSLLTISRDDLREFCMREPALGNQILWKLAATLGQRLRETNRLVSGN